MDEKKTRIYPPKADALKGFCVALEGNGRALETLKSMLLSSGCDILTENIGETITLSPSDDGLKLYMYDEGGNWFDDSHIEAFIALIYFLSGGKKLAAESSSPAVLEQLAAEFGGRVMRIGRDLGAKGLFLSQNILCDAYSKAFFICSFLNKTGNTARELSRLIPEFSLVSRDISLAHSRYEIISAIENENDGLHKENLGVLRVCADGGWISISPSCMKGALRITGEGMTEEIASELCGNFVERAKRLDRVNN